MKNSITVIEGDDLAVVWARAFLRVLAAPGGELSPVIMSVTGFDIRGVSREEVRIRRALDDSLLGSSNGQSCNTVANTIFPSGIWNPDAPAERLYERFLRVSDRVRAYPGNGRGTYFSRMVDFGGTSAGAGVNQLRHVVETWRRGNHRRSALQLAIFDPRSDHSHQRRSGFPCLHQVALAPDQSGRLSLTGFYASQYIYERAYGNLLGLSRLARFLAQELGLQVLRVTCVANTELLGRKTKSQLGGLANCVGQIVSATEASLALSEAATQ